jgi:hypothetical protein
VIQLTARADHGGFCAVYRNSCQLPAEPWAHRAISPGPWSDTMLMTIATILIILWLLGMVTSYTMGGLIHILLVIAVVVILVRVIQGRRVL